jgi:hypothetical protein
LIVMIASSCIEPPAYPSNTGTVHEIARSA